MGRSALSSSSALSSAARAGTSRRADSVSDTEPAGEAVALDPLLDRINSEAQERSQLRDAAGAIATIDLGAMRRNFRTGLAMLSHNGAEGNTDVRPGAVVKANAYGLGAGEVGKVLASEGCRDFFVARITEAVELRKAMQAERPDLDEGIAINVLDGNLAGADPQLLINYRITPVLNSLEQVRAWNAAGEGAGRKLPGILQFDTGMSRAGMDQGEMNELIAERKAGKLENIDVQLIMTHLANAGTAGAHLGTDPRQPEGGNLELRGDLRERVPGDDTQKQLERFNAISANFPGIKQSIGASSTVFLGKSLHKDLVRMGGTFHGQAPFDADSNPLEQVMTLTSKLAQINEYPPGAKVGYSGRFVTDRPMVLGTIPFGYSDGLPRRKNTNQEERPNVLVEGLDGQQYKAEFVGANSMDMSSIDLSNVPPEARKAGAKVILMGGGITPDHFGDMFGTNASETQTKLTRRVFKEVLDENAPSRFAEPELGPSPHAMAWGGARNQATLETQERSQLRDAAGAIATIDLGAMRRNFRTGLAMLSHNGAEGNTDVRPGAVVKANAYGLGAGEVGKVLASEGCRDFFVARITEAVELRKAMQAERPDLDEGIAINVLDGNLAGADPQLLINYRITPVLNSLEQVRAWNAAGEGAGRKLPGILQFDTGMSRAGMDQGEMNELIAERKAGKLENIDVQLIMTHLANAGTARRRIGTDPQRSMGGDTRRQLRNFNKISANFPGIKQSIGASSTVFLGKSLHKDLVRMGGTFHGQAPFDADSNPLEQVMTLTSKLAQINEYPPGAKVGYSGRFVTDRPMVLGTIPFGYSDGLPRRKNTNDEKRPYVLIQGPHGDLHKAEFVGANSMDMSSIDLSNVPHELRKPGTPVILMGGGITPDHFGDMFGTNASETQTKLTRRVFKEVLDENAPSRSAEPALGPSPHAMAWRH